MQHVYFEIDLNLEGNDLELEITLTPLNDKHFKIGLSKGFIPWDREAQWETVSNHILIDENDPLFDPKGSYGLMVTPYDPEDPDNENIDTRNF